MGVLKRHVTKTCTSCFKISRVIEQRFDIARGKPALNVHTNDFGTHSFGIVLLQGSSALHSGQVPCIDFPYQFNVATVTARSGRERHPKEYIRWT